MEIGKINLTKYVFQTGLFSDITGTVSRFSNEFQINKVEFYTIRLTETKALISCLFTAQLTCTLFAFERKSSFVTMWLMYSLALKCIWLSIFSKGGSNVHVLKY